MTSKARTYLPSALGNEKQSAYLRTERIWKWKANHVPTFQAHWEMKSKARTYIPSILGNARTYLPSILGNEKQSTYLPTKCIGKWNAKHVPTYQAHWEITSKAQNTLPYNIGKIYIEPTLISPTTPHKTAPNLEKMSHYQQPLSSIW